MMGSVIATFIFSAVFDRKKTKHGITLIPFVHNTTVQKLYI